MKNSDLKILLVEGNINDAVVAIRALRKIMSPVISFTSKMALKYWIFFLEKEFTRAEIPIINQGDPA
jgi:hypothetical protein